MGGKILQAVGTMGLNLSRDCGWRCTYLGVPLYMEVSMETYPGRKHGERGYTAQGSIHR